MDMNNYGNDIVPQIDIAKIVSKKEVVRCISKLGYNRISPLQYRAYVSIIKRGKSILIVSPTGTGKTEAALFPVLADIYENKLNPINAIYITPLRALNRDIANRIKNIACCFNASVEVWHGDTPRSSKKRIKENPPHIIITTPESFHYIIVNPSFRQYMSNLKYVIIDEFREMVSSKRGVELLSAIHLLEKLINRRVIKIALTATLSNYNKVRQLLDNPVYIEIVSSQCTKGLDIEIMMPGSDQYLTGDLNNAGETVDPLFYGRLKAIADIIRKNRCVLLFVNTRDLVERVVWGLSTLFKDIKVAAHHGSLSRAHRLKVEKEFKAGMINAIVATSSLELGLDIGVVKHVIQYMSPRQVVRLVQRIGRSLHRFSLTPRGTIIVLNNFFDAVEAIAIARRAIVGDIEEEEIPDKPLDVLAHQIMELLLLKPGIDLNDIYLIFYDNRVFKGIEYDTFLSVIEYLRYSRLIKVKDNRVYPTYRGRLYFLKTTMIPDVKNVDVVDIVSGRRVGILNEDFVTVHCVPGTEIVLAGGLWRVIDYDEKLYVEPCTKEEGIASVPWWEGESIPVDYKVAREIGAMMRLLASTTSLNKGDSWLQSLYEIPIFKHRRDYKRHLKISQGVVYKVISTVRSALKDLGVIPSDKHLVIEVCRREKLVAIYSFLGSKANNLLKEVLASLLRARYSANVHAIASPYYIIFRLPMQPTKSDIYDVITRLIKMFANNEAIKEIIKSSSHFLWRVFFVAQRFGAVDPEKNINKSILVGFKDTVVGDEALSEVLLRDFDLDVAREFVEKIRTGSVKVSIIERESPSTLLNEALSRIPNYPIKALSRDIGAYKLRLFSRDITLVCILCGHRLRAKLGSLDETMLICPRCRSKALAPVKGDGAEEARLVKKVLNKERLTRMEQKAFRELQERAALVMNYGIDAVIALAGRGIGPFEARRVLYKYKTSGKDLFELMLDAEKKFLRTRRFFDK